MEEKRCKMESGTPVSDRNYSLCIDSMDIILSTKIRSFCKKSDTEAILCRCGFSGHKPFCDGNHADMDWHPALRVKKRCNKQQ